MSLHHDHELTQILQGWKMPPPPAGFTDAIAGRALSHRQRAYPVRRFLRMAGEVGSELFDTAEGFSAVSRWRVAAAMMMLVIGFTSGYMSELRVSNPDEPELTATLDVDEEWAEAI